MGSVEQRTMPIRLERPGQEAMKGMVMEGDLGAVREAMFAYQQYTEADEIIVYNDDDNSKIARMTFEWIDG